MTQTIVSLIDRASIRLVAGAIKLEGKKYDQRWWGTVPSDMEDGSHILPMDMEVFKVHCTSTACLFGMAALVGGYQLLAYEGDSTIEDVLLPDSDFVLTEDGYLGAECQTTSVSDAGMQVLFPGLEPNMGETEDGTDWYDVAGNMSNSDWAAYTLRDIGKEGIAAILDKVGRTRSDAKAFEIIHSHSWTAEYQRIEEGLPL